MNYEDILLKVILEKKSQEYVGLIINRISNINIELLLEKMNGLGEKFYISLVGKPAVDKEYENIVIDYNIEKAVEWRSNPEYANKIIVFIDGETEKMHSLAEFFVITQRDLSKYLIEDRISNSTNEPTKRFWLAIKEKISSFPFKMICDYFNNTDLNNQTSMLDNLWRLGLIKDGKIFSTSSSASERLSKNQDILKKMATLSDINRKKINSSLSKATNDKTKLKETYELINNYFRFHSPETLSKLDMQYVEKLLEASKEKTKSSDKKDDDKGKQRDDLIRKDDLVDSFNRAFVNKDDDSLKSLKEDLDAIKDYYKKMDDEEDFDPSSPVSLNSGKQTIPVVNDDFRNFIMKFTNENVWGGIIRTDEKSIDSILNDTSIETEYFDIYSSPYLIFHDENIEDVFSKLDEDLKDVDPEFSKYFGLIKKYRLKLIDKIDLLLNYPTPLFSTDQEARKDLIEYVKAYQSLYKTLSENKSNIESISISTMNYLTRVVLSLNNVYVIGKNDNQLKSIMMPLNPLFLWKYFEVFSGLADNVSEDDADALVDSLNNLPNLITHQYVKTEDEAKGVNLPYCGLVKNCIPYYEDNKLKGIDGVDQISEILQRWVAYAPYTKNELRIGIVDSPVILSCLDEVSKFISEFDSKIIIDFYFTDELNHYSELAYLSDCDDSVTEMIENNRIVFHIYEKQTDAKIRENISHHPLHILFFFDQCSYVNGTGEAECQTKLSPLVPTYEYSYDKYIKAGWIYPTNNTDSGIIGSYFGFLKQNGFVSPNTVPVEKTGSTAKLEFPNSALSDGLALWEVIADRTVHNYAPSNAICVGEKMLNKRNLCIYAHESSRIINDFEKILRQYSLDPSKSKLVDILKKFAHISSEGLIAIPKSNSENVENRRKGLIGTIFSAYLYKEILHKDSLIASLDSKQASVWISNFKEGNDRADLLGLWFDDNNNTLNFDVLEVKTRDENPDEKHAAEQAIKIGDILNSIFVAGQENIFSSSRREVLKKQLVNECFRGIYDSDWQLKWEDIFKKAFISNPQYKIKINKYVYHMKLSSFDDGCAKYLVNDKDNTVVMHVVTAKDIQDYLFDQKQFDFIKFDSIKECNSNENVIDVDNINFDNPLEDDYLENDSSVDNKDEEKNDYIQNNSISETKSNCISSYEDNKEEIQKLGKAFFDSCRNRKIKIIADDFKNNLNNVIVGSRVYRYYFKLEKGSNLDSLINQLDDIGREIKRSGLIVSNMLNDDRIILDIPRLKADNVDFSSIIDKITDAKSPEELYFPIGREPDGNDVFKNLAELPHMLVGGSTGSGKTVFLHCLICSLLMSHKNSNDLKLIISSAGIEDFVYFENVPHLMNNKIITSAKETVDVIKNVVNQEFEERARILSEVKAKNIIEYNEKSDKKLAPIVIVIDEFADIADQLTNKKEKEDFYMIVRRIVQIGRKRGIHMVLCTQRPSANLVPTDIRAQLTARLALRVADASSSRMILDETGAQNLQKHGDLIFKFSDGVVRAQGYNITTDEVEKILEDLQ